MKVKPLIVPLKYGRSDECHCEECEALRKIQMASIEALWKRTMK